MSFERNYYHRSRHTPFGGSTGEGQIIMLGQNWTGAAFVWSFSTTPNAPAGSAATGFTLNAATAGSQGVSVTYDANYVHPKTGAVVGASIITPQIDETTLEALTFTGTADLVLYHDLLVTPSGQPQRCLLNGTLTIAQGIGD